MTQFAVNVVVLAALYVTLAAGYVLVYRASKLLNFAHGDVMILGGYVLFTVGSLSGGQPLIAIPLALVSLAVIAMVLYASPVRAVVGQPIFTGILVTIGLSIVLRSAITLIWTPENIMLGKLVGLRDVIHLPGDGVTSSGDLMKIVAAVLYCGAIAVFLRFTTIGRQTRAVGENLLLAAQCGVNVYFVMAVVWVIAAVGGALAGVLLQNLYPEAALIGIKAIPVAILGGMGSMAGVVPAALIVALAETAATQFGDPLLSEAVPMILMLIILLVRPWGLLGHEEELTRV